MIDLKDENLEWEYRALIRQLDCLLDTPEEVCVDCPMMVAGLSKQADSLLERARAEINQPRMNWERVHQLLNHLSLELDKRMTDLHLLVLIKRREHFQGIVNEHPMDEARLAAKAMVGQIDTAIAELSTR